MGHDRRRRGKGLPVHLRRCHAPSLIAALSAASPHGANAETSGLPACEEAMVLDAAAPERDVRIETPDGTIVGTLAGPSKNPPLARALLLHGYTGARDEIPVAGGEGMFARTARALAERGIATLRIDFLGSGESDGVWADTTFEGQARDALRALAALTEEPAVGDAIPTGVLGYSQGGLVALRAASMSDAFDRIALWNPVLDPSATYGLILRPETLAEGAARHEAGDMEGQVGASRLRPGFFVDIATADPAVDARMTIAEILIVTGRNDTIVMNGAALAESLAEGRAAPTLILDLDAGHDLGAVSDIPRLDWVIACTAGFILGGVGSQGRDG